VSYNQHFQWSDNMTAREILQKAIEFDALGFRAALITQANQHADYEELSRDARAAQGARASKNACLRAYDWIGRDDLPAGERAACIFADTCGVFVVALNAACKLLGIPAAQRTAAAIEWEG
jgi:hypothetical protein